MSDHYCCKRCGQRFDRCICSEERVTPKRICLVCGRSEPCELDKMETTPPPHNTPETWPGSPCTFDPRTVQESKERGDRPDLITNLKDEIERLRARVEELEGKK